MLGAPLLFLVANSPVAFFLTKGMMAFLPNASLLLLLFVPKMWALHQHQGTASDRDQTHLSVKRTTVVPSHMQIQE